MEYKMPKSISFGIPIVLFSFIFGVFLTHNAATVAPSKIDIGAVISHVELNTVDGRFIWSGTIISSVQGNTDPSVYESNILTVFHTVAPDEWLSADDRSFNDSYKIREGTEEISVIFRDPYDSSIITIIPGHFVACKPSMDLAVYKISTPGRLRHAKFTRELKDIFTDVRSIVGTPFGVSSLLEGVITSYSSGGMGMHTNIAPLPAASGSAIYSYEDNEWRISGIISGHMSTLVDKYSISWGANSETIKKWLLEEDIVFSGK